MLNKNEFIQTLLDIAEQDLASSKILYKKKKYPQSIFLLQQSVEKTAKAYGLFEGSLSIKQLEKDISHKTPIIYRKFADRELRKGLKLKKNIETHEDLQKLSFLQEIDLKNYCDNQKLMIKEINDSLNKKEILTDNEKNLVDGLKGIKFILSDLKQPKDKEIKIPKEEIEKQLDKVIKPIIELYKEKGMEIPEDWKKDLKKLDTIDFDEFMKYFIKQLIKLHKINTLNFFLSLITFQHVGISRYPEDKSPLERYNKNYPLIKHFKEIYKLQRDNIKKHKDVLIKGENTEKIIKKIEGIK